MNKLPVLQVPYLMSKILRVLFRHPSGWSLASKILFATYTAKTIQISYPKIAQKMKPDPIVNTN